MKQPIQNNWNRLKKDFTDCQKSAKGLAQIASVDEANVPNITPIGSLFLQADKKAFFCNRFPENLNRNITTNPRICAIAMQNSQWFWLSALFKGKFKSCPGVKLYGRVSERRPIRDEEREQWEKAVRLFRFSKGYDLLWKDMTHVSDVEFDSYEYIRAGKMTQGVSE